MTLADSSNLDEILQILNSKNLIITKKNKLVAGAGFSAIHKTIFEG